MKRSSFSALCAVAILASWSVTAGAQSWTPPAPPADAPEDQKAALQEADSLYGTRDSGDHSEQVLHILRDQATKYPDSFAVEWRLARILFWIAEATPDKAKHRQLGEEGWEAGKKAIAANPGAPEGHYFKAICVGEVAHSVGILTALSKGLEGEFRDPLLKAEKINPATGYGGIYRGLGRYKFELPWPKRDYDESVKYLRRALEINPADLRARLYLAETLSKRDGTGDVDEGKRLLKEVADAPVGHVDPPEDRRVKKRAVELATRLGW